MYTYIFVILIMSGSRAGFARASWTLLTRDPRQMKSLDSLVTLQACSWNVYWRESPIRAGSIITIRPRIIIAETIVVVLVKVNFVHILLKQSLCRKSFNLLRVEVLLTVCNHPHRPDDSSPKFQPSKYTNFVIRWPPRPFWAVQWSQDTLTLDQWPFKCVR